MEKEPGRTELQNYVRTCAASIYRARFIVIVLITASVLTFFASWNSRGESWINKRIIRDEQALKIFPAQNGKPSVGCNPSNPAENARLLSLKESGLSEADYNAAKTYVCDMDKSREQLENHLRQLVTLKVEQVTRIHIPFFGVSIDINDLGLFAGLTFVVILLWFRFSLLRELNNIKIAFGMAGSLHTDFNETVADSNNLKQEVEHRRKEKDQKPQWERQYARLRYCYDILAMQQVLTEPPRSDLVYLYLSRRRHWFRRAVIRLRFWFSPFYKRLPAAERTRQLRSLAHKLRNYFNQTYARWLLNELRRRWPLLRKFVWSTVPKILYSLPFIVQLFVFQYDLESLPVGYAINQPGTKRIVQTEIVLLITIAALTILCTVIAEKIDKLWRDVYKQLTRLERELKKNSDPPHRQLESRFSTVAPQPLHRKPQRRKKMRSPLHLDAGPGSATK